MNDLLLATGTGTTAGVAAGDGAEDAGAEDAGAEEEGVITAGAGKERVEEADGLRVEENGREEDRMSELISGAVGNGGERIGDGCDDGERTGDGCGGTWAFRLP